MAHTNRHERPLFVRRDLTTAVSHILDGFSPAYNPPSVQIYGTRVRNPGNEPDEFAMGSSNRDFHHGAVENPWRTSATDNKKYVPGGSPAAPRRSSLRMALAATGTDTSADPATGSFCGIVGELTTAEPRWGVAALRHRWTKRAARANRP